MRHVCRLAGNSDDHIAFIDHRGRRQTKTTNTLSARRSHPSTTRGRPARMRPLLRGLSNHLSPLRARDHGPAGVRARGSRPGPGLAPPSSRATSRRCSGRRAASGSRRAEHAVGERHGTLCARRPPYGPYAHQAPHMCSRPRGEYLLGLAQLGSDAARCGTDGQRVAVRLWQPLSLQGPLLASAAGHWPRAQPP
jgi:hypothetical protein